MPIGVRPLYILWATEVIFDIVADPGQLRQPPSMLPAAPTGTTGAGGSGAPARLPPCASLNHRVLGGRPAGSRRGGFSSGIFTPAGRRGGASSPVGGRRGTVLLVADVLAPRGGTALFVDFVHR